jgi:hypothetical protein
MEFFSPINEFRSANNGMSTEREHPFPDHGLCSKWPRDVGVEKGQPATRAGGRPVRKT